MSGVRDGRPLDHVLRGEWPRSAVLRSGAPASAYLALTIARRVIELTETHGVSLREVSRRAGVSHTTMARVIGGQVLCDIGTLGRLEAALGVDLWPRLRDRPKA